MAFKCRAVFSLLFLHLTVLVSSAQAVEFNDSNYNVYIGDLNSDNVDDIYLQAVGDFILLHGEIAVPLILPTTASSYIIYSNSTYYDEPVVNNNININSLSAINTHVALFDYNSDGDLDLIVEQAGSTHSNIVIAGSNNPNVIPVLLDSDINYTDVAGVPVISSDPDNDTINGSQYNGVLQGQHNISNDGSFNYELAIDVPPGIQGVQPEINLSYSSRRTNGPLGWGWSIDGLSAVTRCNASLIRDSYVSGVNPGDNYKFCLDGRRLIEISASEYRTENELFARIKRVNGTALVPGYWRVERKDGSILTYGDTTDSQWQDSAEDTMSWRINKQQDIAGNYLTYHYDRSLTVGTHRIARIEYTKNDSAQNTNHQIQFEYDTNIRPDAYTIYSAGSKLAENNLLKKVIVKSNDTTVRSYELSYQQFGQSYDGALFEDPSQTSRLNEVKLCFSSNSICSSPVHFKWTRATENDFIVDASDGGYSYTIAEDIAASHYPTVNRLSDLQNISNSVNLTDTQIDLSSMSSSNGYQALNSGAVRGDFDGDGLNEAVWLDCALPVSNIPNLHCDRKVSMSAQGAGHVFKAQSKVFQLQETLVNSSSSLAYKLKTGGAIDFNGDGLDDYYIASSGVMTDAEVYISDGITLNYSSSYSLSTQDIGVQTGFINVGGINISMPWGYRIIFKDLTGDGLVDVLKFPMHNNSSNFGSIGDLGIHEISVAVNTGTGFDDFVQWGSSIDYLSYYAETNLGQLILADVNGDSLPDIVGLDGEVGLNTGASFSYDASWKASINLPALVLPPGTIALSQTTQVLRELTNAGDVNGDGLVDLVALRHNGVYIALSNGQQFLPAQLWTTEFTSAERLGCGDACLPTLGNWSVQDINADGKSDIVSSRTWGVPHSSSQQGSSEIVGLLSKGKLVGSSGFSSLFNISSIVNDFDNRVVLPVINQYGEFIVHRVPAMSGLQGLTGIEDKVHNDVINIGIKRHKILGVFEANAKSIDVEYAKMGVDSTVYSHNALSNISNTHATVQFQRKAFYSSAEPSASGQMVSDLSVPTLSRGREVVASVSVDNIGVNKTLTDLHYTNHRIHLAGFGHLGFESIEKTTTLGGSLRQTKELTDFYQIADSNYLLAGRPSRSRMFASNEALAGNPLQLISDQSFQWKVRLYEDDLDAGFNSPHYFPYVYASHTQHYDLGGGATYESVQENFAATSVDCSISLGNILTTNTDEEYDADGNLVYSRNTKCDVNSLSAKATELVSVTNKVTSDQWVLGLVTKNKEHAWRKTGATLNSEIRTTAYSYNALGQMSQKIVEPDQVDLKLISDYQYDSYGFINQLTKSWDSQVDNGLAFNNRTTYINNTYNTAGVRTKVFTNALNQIATTKYDEVFGLPVSSIDINNRQTISSYDDLGRLYSVTYPDGVTSQTEYRVCNNCFAYNNNASWYSHTKTTGQTAKRLFYDDLGRGVGSRIKDGTGNYIYTAKTYSDQGHVLSASEPFYNIAGRVDITYSYDILNRLEQTDYPDGSHSSLTYNGLTQVFTNRLQQTEERIFDHGGKVIKSVDALNSWVDYTYTPWGNLQTTRINNNNATKITLQYDLLGRKTQLNDPNTGLINYYFNPLGLLASEVDAKGQHTLYEYDKLGRQIKRIDNALAVDSQFRTHTWEYDTAVGNGKGLLASINGYNTDGSTFAETYEYTGDSLLSKTTTVFDGRSFVSKIIYDAFSREVGVVYPSNYATVKQYNDYGFAGAIKANNLQANIWQANSFDARSNVTSYTLGNGVITDTTFDVNTGLISTINATKSGIDIQDQAYDFDFLGNLKSRTDTRASLNLTEHFCYDALNRLVANDIGSSCGTADFSYDVYGNILSKTGVNGIYSYGLNAGPNAVTTANNKTYQYDANGNLVASSDGTLVAYSSFNKPLSIVKGGKSSTLVYGPHKSRIKRIDSNGRTTVYGALASYEETSFNGLTESTHYLGDFALYTQQSGTGNNSFYTYQHRDHLGSVVARSNQSVNSMVDIQWFANNPWGERLQETWDGLEESVDYSPGVTARGFTDHEHLDNVGLIHMNGRVYDPILGRFLSSDIYIQAPYNTQSYNRYSYVFNNPLSFTDPSGFTTIVEEVVVTGPRPPPPPKPTFSFSQLRGLASIAKTNIISATITTILTTNMMCSTPGCGSAALKKEETDADSSDEGDEGDESSGENTEADSESASDSLSTGSSGGSSGGSGDEDPNNDKDGKKSNDASKNEKHGDGGRAQTKAEKQIQKLEGQKQSASGRKKKQIDQKIKNIKRDAARKAKGEEHSRTKKR